MKEKIKNSHVRGIDLGTTNTVCAQLSDTGTPEIIPDRDGNQKTSSVVYVNMDLSEISVGECAMNMRCIEPESVIVSPKRDVGTDKVYFRRGNTKFDSVRGQGEILRYVRQSAIERTGDDQASLYVTITVPAYYGEKERQSVKAAAEFAGMEVLGIISEPTAAALAYNLQAKQGDRTILVADFGGGTFDASLIQQTGWEVNVLATHGDRSLGGDDVTSIILGRIVREFSTEHSMEITKESNPADYYQVWDEADRVKRMLSSRKEVKIGLRIDGKTVSFSLDRNWLKSASKEIIGRVGECVRKTIEIAAIDANQIDHILLVGGSSRLLVYREYFETAFGKDLILGGDISPDLAVAEGAAVHAAKLIEKSGKALVDEENKSIPTPNVKTTDTMAHSLGVAVQDAKITDSHCSVILDRGSPIPITQTKSYKSLTPDQVQFSIQVLQGEEGMLLDQCLVVGEKILDLPPRDPAVPSLQVTMGYDADGMVHVEVLDMISNQSQDITVDFFKKGSR